MGVDVDKDEFTSEDYAAFSERLEDNLTALRELLARREFGRGPASMGAEVEMFLVDAQGQPLLVSQQVLDAARDDCFTVELDRFNVECNTAPCELTASPFTSLSRELHQRVAQLEQAAGQHGGRLALTGILPTLEHRHFQASSMTDIPRYRALNRTLRSSRQRPFEIHIDGPEPLHFQHDNVTLEGASTSLQLHLKVKPQQFARVYNAAQLATAPALAASGNSPTLLGHQLWEETRIALFKQSVDERTPDEHRTHRQPRVGFGDGWVSEGPLELFEANIRHFAPMLPVVGKQDALSIARAGGIPDLAELRLHSGTVWRWNRPVYDTTDQGHVRIELRALPAGPSIDDMLANAAFLLGLTLGLCQSKDHHVTDLGFDLAEHNFYRSAQLGLSANLYWPAGKLPRSELASELVPKLIPLARDGLLEAGVPVTDFEPWLEIFEARVVSGRTGARWQRARLAKIEGQRPGRQQALNRMLLEYLELSGQNQPVHRWPQ